MRGCGQADAVAQAVAQQRAEDGGAAEQHFQFIAFDGESTWLEGASLIALYGIIATAFLPIAAAFR